MLNQRKDITEVAPPFLLSMPDNTWHLVKQIEKLTSEHYVCHCIQINENNFNEYTKEILEAPFHVAENIWELSYNVEIMTLMDSSLNAHPANTLWQQWKTQQSN